MAEIQFSRGVTEEVIPDVRVTRSPTGNTGTATFLFEDPKILSKESSDEITGMYLVDDEGEIYSKEVKRFCVDVCRTFYNSMTHLID